MNMTHISTRRLTSAFATGAFALLGLSAQAQVASNPYGAQRSAASAPGAGQANTQSGVSAGRPLGNSAAYGRANSAAPYGRANSANSAARTNGSNTNNLNNSNNANSNVFTGGNALSYFGYPDFSGYGAFVGQPFTAGPANGFDGFSNGTNGGTLAGGNITVVGSPLYGGFATLGPTGSYSFGQTGGYSPYGDPFSGQYNPNYTGVNTVSGSSANGRNIQAAPAQPAAPTLAQSLIIRRGQNFDLSVGWRGDPALISGLKVTLLDRLHLPLTQQTAESGSAAYFPANKNTYAARYYRVDVQYADGTTGSLTAALQR